MIDNSNIIPLVNAKELADKTKEEKFRRWHRKYSSFINTSDIDHERLSLIMNYMLRYMSMGLIPEHVVVHDFLFSDKELPICGHIGCLIDFEHVH